MTNAQNQIENLLRQKLGLKADSISSRRIGRALEIRRLACNLADFASYFQLLKTSQQEWWELVEQIVVPETWFFRHRESFRFLQQIATNTSYPLRILSAPCSTGEEPYSIAIALLEIGIKPEQFEIDALDISQKSLEKGKKAIYTNHSFRDDSLRQNQVYFKPVIQGYQICDLVRSKVNFKHANLLAPQLPLKKKYHIIFCRHLLIYLDFSARSRAIDVLEGLLTQAGFIFVGSPEIALLKPPRFQPVDYPYAFAYKKGEEKVTRSTQVEKTNLNQIPQQKKVTEEGHLELDVIPPPLEKGETPTNSELKTTNDSPLEKAKRLADEGKLDEAIYFCQLYLNQNPSEHQAHLLLGQIYQAKGDETQAEKYFQKVIYLAPNSYEALMYLTMIKESNGDFKGASLLRQRIQRLEQREQ